MREAHHFPGAFVQAGRIGFVFLGQYLGGSMLMRLPSGRCLTYRALWEPSRRGRRADRREAIETDLRARLWPDSVVARAAS
jgi:hypothetical protein